jgi:hypothetical protein
MTTAPAIAALALVELIGRHLAAPGDTDARTQELRALLADPRDDMIHADYVVDVAKELATIVVGMAARARVPLDEFIGDYRRRLLARGDDA